MHGRSDRTLIDLAGHFTLTALTRTSRHSRLSFRTQLKRWEAVLNPYRYILADNQRPNPSVPRGCLISCGTLPRRASCSRKTRTQNVNHYQEIQIVLEQQLAALSGNASCRDC
jgi:hypothetical protein